MLQHQNSLERMKAVARKSDHDKLILNPGIDIQNLNKKLNQEESNKYIKGIKLVFSSLIFLVKQGMPIRGHNEHPDSKKHGKFSWS